MVAGREKVQPVATVSIGDEVKQAAWRHLKSEDAEAALSCYEPDAIGLDRGSHRPSDSGRSARADFCEGRHDLELESVGELQPLNGQFSGAKRLPSDP